MRSCSGPTRASRGAARVAAAGMASQMARSVASAHEISGVTRPSGGWMTVREGPEFFASAARIHSGGTEERGSRARRRRQTRAIRTQRTSLPLSLRYAWYTIRSSWISVPRHLCFSQLNSCVLQSHHGRSIESDGADDDFGSLSRYQRR